MPRLRPHPIETKKSVRSWATAFLRNHGKGPAIRFECEPGSGLLELLRDLGYTIRPVEVDVYEIDLPVVKN